MVMLYNYLTSNDFQLKIESIVEGFTQLQNDLNREKNAMFRIWNQREKQIQKVLINTTEMYGDIKGIAGHSIPNIRQLELPMDQNPVFDLKDRLGADSHRGEQRGMEVGDADRVFDCDAGPLSGRFAVDKALLHTAPEQHH